MKKGIFIFFIVFLLVVSGCSPKSEVSQAQITILNPVNGASVPGSGLVNILVEVSSNVPLSKVRFYVDGSLLAEDSISPYKAIWDTSYYKHGTSHAIKVEAVDSGGKVVGSSSIICYVNVEWTILMYLDGHNNLAGCIQKDIEYIKSFSRTDGANILILAGPYQFVSNSYLYYFHNGKLDELANGSLNFGDANNLYSFLKYGVANFPAKKYLVVLENHGSGWRSPSKLDRDICFDEIYGDSLTIPELREGLSYFAEIGKKIDLLYLDACVMGNLEVAYELKDVAKYLIFSEATAYGPTRWDEIMSYILNNITTTPENLGRKIIDIYYNEYYYEYPITMSLIELTKIDPIMSELYNLSIYLMNTLPDSAYAIMNIRLNALAFEPYDNSNPEYIDINDFAYKIIDSLNYSDLNNSAYRLINYVNYAVIYNRYFGYNSPCGLSIWFPYTPEDFANGLDKYYALRFTSVDGGFAWLYFIYSELSSYYQVSIPGF